MRAGKYLCGFGFFHWFKCVTTCDTRFTNKELFKSPWEDRITNVDLWRLVGLGFTPLILGIRDERGDLYQFIAGNSCCRWRPTSTHTQKLFACIPLKRAIWNNCNKPKVVQSCSTAADARLSGVKFCSRIHFFSAQCSTIWLQLTAKCE